MIVEEESASVLDDARLLCSRCAAGGGCKGAAAEALVQRHGLGLAIDTEAERSRIRARHGRRFRRLVGLAVGGDLGEGIACRHVLHEGVAPRHLAGAGDAGVIGAVAPSGQQDGRLVEDAPAHGRVVGLPALLHQKQRPLVGVVRLFVDGAAEGKLARQWGEIPIERPERIRLRLPQRLGAALQVELQHGVDDGRLRLHLVVLVSLEPLRIHGAVVQQERLVHVGLGAGHEVQRHLASGDFEVDLRAQLEHRRVQAFEHVRRHGQAGMALAPEMRTQQAIEAQVPYEHDADVKQLRVPQSPGAQQRSLEAFQGLNSPGHCDRLSPTLILRVAGSTRASLLRQQVVAEEVHSKAVSRRRRLAAQVRGLQQRLCELEGLMLARHEA
eukprot:scaffold149_cov315-Pinguiococcus_pyrenoidosus.AAC.140